MEPLLIAQHLHKSFGQFAAVKDISLQVEPGECLALLGPNGAGKTTCVEMLEGLLKPDRGEIRIFGLTLLKHRQRIMQDIGVMLQDTKLYKKFTVTETLSLFASFFNKSIAVDAAIEMVALQEKAKFRLDQLSGGQNQRVYLACSLINEPRLLFLDEPTTGLDPQSRLMIWELLNQHKRRERGILLTTHSMDEAEKLADRIAIVDQGQIIAEGSPETLIRKHCGEQVLCFRFANITADEAQRQLLLELPWLAHTLRSGDSFEMVVENPIEKMSELIRKSEQQGLLLAQLEMRRSTLEDVFIKLTGRRIRDA